MQPESKVNVLLVDDHPENLLALEAVLDSPDQNLVKAHSGAEALRCLLNQDFAVILLDVQMPGMDGFETATLIRNRPRSQDTPIIFLTAFSTSDTMRFKGYALGAVDYLFKPVEPEILASKVGVFVDLFKKTAEVKRQATQLAAINSELRESEERFRSLSACSPVGIFLTDVEGRCTYTNPRFQVICGITLEKSLGDGWLQSVDSEDRPQVIADWSAWTLANREYESEFRIKTPQGIVRQVHVRASPMLSNQGELMGHVGTVEDITERKQTEAAHALIIREQAARAEAEAANRMKDEFLATLSHELRTPLNSVLGWARLLRTRSFDEATIARALETIERNAKSQSQMIEDILDVSRIIRGKLLLNLRPINLIPVIETAIESVRPVAEAKSLKLQHSVDTSLAQLPDNCLPFSGKSVKRATSTNGGLKNNSSYEGIFVNGDPERLQQIVWNLLSNAIKFTPEGGQVELRLLCVGSHVQIQVIDTGMGIKPDFLPHVFDRFRQADSTTTRSHGGLGLGLAIVRHLVELHRGTVFAESEGEGKGATFIVELPLFIGSKEATVKNRDRENVNDLPPPTSHSLLNGLQILIVDDELDVRELLITVIEQAGAKALAVASVSEALDTLERLHPDILISDIGMPGEDGYTLIRKLRNLEAERGGHLPSIALTAYVRDEDSTEAIKSGFQLHISKPVDPTELVTAVANLVGRTAQEQVVSAERDSN